MADVISVRFRGGTKQYYFDPKGIAVASHQDVIVETAQGLECAQCVQGNHQVPDESIVHPLRGVARLATEADQKTVENNRRREKEAFGICEKKIAAHALEMKLVRVECAFEGSKITFFFTADGRVDFRELVRDLAGVFHSRIELRQIGVRDEAKMLGGLGICGRPLCCSQFMEEFIPVSIKMAKTQNLSLNPAKISGTCGRLMCCLKYEQLAYEDAAKRLPKNDSFVDTPDGPGNISSVDMLREEVLVRLDSAPETPKRYKPCELNVLRSGKGSRDGIELPTQHPARYVPPETEEDRYLRLSQDFSAPEPEDRPRRERVRGGELQEPQRGQSKPKPRPKVPAKGGAEAKKSQPQKGKPQRVPKPERVEKVHASATQEKKAAADRAARGQESRPQENREGRENRPRRYRPRRRSGNKGQSGGES